MWHTHENEPQRTGAWCLHAEVTPPTLEKQHCAISQPCDSRWHQQTRAWNLFEQKVARSSVKDDNVLTTHGTSPNGHIVDDNLITVGSHVLTTYRGLIPNTSFCKIVQIAGPSVSKVKKMCWMLCLNTNLWGVGPTCRTALEDVEELEPYLPRSPVVARHLVVAEVGKRSKDKDHLGVEAEVGRAPVSHRCSVGFAKGKAECHVEEAKGVVGEVTCFASRDWYEPKGSVVAAWKICSCDNSSHQ